MSDPHNDPIIQLCNGITHAKLYPGNHPRVQTAARQFLDHLKGLFLVGEESSFFLGVVDGKLVHEGRYLIGPTIVGHRLVELATQLHCGGFLFENGITMRDVTTFFSVAAECRESCEDLAAARLLLSARGVRHIELSPTYEDPGWFGQFLFKGTDAWHPDDPCGNEAEESVAVYQSLFATVGDVHSQAERRVGLDIANARSVSERLLTSTENSFTDIMQMVRYPDYDCYTVGHSVRVASILTLVCSHLGVDRDVLVEIATAGLLHDVGKSRIPDEILYKPGSLNDEERMIMQQHARFGAEILLENRTAGPRAVVAAWAHHLRHDGGGYPDHVMSVRPGWLPSLLHVCDVFEALTAIRPYKPNLSPRRAYEIMLSDRQGYDPGSIRVFLSAMGLYPPGSRVILSSGQRGVVVTAGAEFDRPTVRLTHDCGGSILAAQDVPHLDLCKSSSRNVSVVGLVDEWDVHSKASEGEIKKNKKAA